MIKPILKTVTVQIDPPAAFHLFTARLFDWWPAKSHSLSAAIDALPLAIDVEPFVGGQVIETLQDGSKKPWGTVTEWAPGRVFETTWHVGRDANEASQVRVTFEPVGGGTKVTLIHDGWEALGDEGPSLRHNYHSGWDHVFGTCYLEFVGRKIELSVTLSGPFGGQMA